MNSSACVSCSSGHETGMGAPFTVAFFALKKNVRLLEFFFVIAVLFCFCQDNSQSVAPNVEIKPLGCTTGVPCSLLPPWNAVRAGRERKNKE